MDHDSENRFVPRAPRFEVTNPGETLVTICRTGENGDESFPARLVDISQHGVKLRVQENFRFEEAVQLKIEVFGSELEYQGVASVRHIRPVDDESWVVGCAIAPPLSDETFSYLATTAGKERRRFRRLPIAATGIVRRQAEPEGCAATLHNLSSGGFCCSSAMHYEVGESIHLTIDDTQGEERLVEARVCWQIDGPDGSIVGCQFSSRNSYAELCACLTEQPVPEAQARGEVDSTSRLVLTAAVLAMFVPPMMTLLLQAKKVSADAGQAPALVETAGMLSDDVSANVIERPDQALEKVAPLTAPLAENQQLAKTRQAKTAIEQPLPPALQLSATREWVDNTGKHRTVAKLIEVTPDFVVLQKPGGRNAQVPWRRLSEADRQYASDWHARHQ